jgi:hypothetical protein
MKISAKASCRTGHKARSRESGGRRSSPTVLVPANFPEAPWRRIANDNQARIVILPVLRNEGSDRRESEDLSSSIPHYEQLSTILIANPELEFHLTGCRTNHIKFSNRKFLAFSSPIPHSVPLPACSSTQVVLIYGGAIRIPRNTLKRCGIKISNRR